MQADHPRPNDSKISGICTVLLGMAAIGLGGMVGTIGLIREVGTFGPTVGDIIAFDAQAPMSQDMTAHVTAVSAGRFGASCDLDIQAMHKDGGSVIVESRGPETDGGIRIHWAGGRTSADPTNCGSSADLLVGQGDMEILALAAGGYGPASARHGHGTLQTRTASAQ